LHRYIFCWHISNTLDRIAGAKLVVDFFRRNIYSGREQLSMIIAIVLVMRRVILGRIIALWPEDGIYIGHFELPILRLGKSDSKG